ncbi:matrix metalloproteinase-2-like [Eriocheir sinensis]|uniref:matrix metalloproteinase-2-like n=1 Tax=Eriocheir sinensis TaxID=95602 RepID=UPI0021CAE2C1|nr:matrix metalloproteinase-2-like [Eriocheir sinensis]
MAMRGRWRAAAVLLLWLLGIVGGVPVGKRRPYHAHNPQLARLEGGAREDRARREIETEERPKPRPGSPLHALEFMQKFGYVEKKSENVEEDADFVFTPQSLEEALLRVQEFGGIPQTGKLDEATVKLMETPRCGLPDLKPEELERGDGKHNRVKRYIIGADGWNKRRITYFVANWSPQLPSKERVQKELRRAFDTWSVYSHLSFSEVLTPDADIIIYFATQDHGDGYPFDYEGGILAHAFYPYEFGSYGGDIHFDESENWIIAKNKDDEGLDFFTVAVHELGHSLGLSHSPVGGSIMYPYYMGFNPSFALDYDDVMAMWELYIKRKLDGDDEYFNTTTTTTTTSHHRHHQEHYHHRCCCHCLGDGGYDVVRELNLHVFLVSLFLSVFLDFFLFISLYFSSSPPIFLFSIFFVFLSFSPNLSSFFSFNSLSFFSLTIYLSLFLACSFLYFFCFLLPYFLCRCVSFNQVFSTYLLII